MANAEQLSILMQGADVWNAWRKANKKERINLRTANLAGLHLAGVNLNGAVLIDADLTSALLVDASLRGANLGRACFKGAYLRQADFTKANLRKANLHSVDLRASAFRLADLREANIENGTISRAFFSGADLRGVNFTKANLFRTSFNSSKLNSANISEARCEGTIFVDTDLSNVLGFETVHHTGPSKLGLDTLFQTKPRLPDVFLRGCGVSETLIEYLPYMLNNAIDFYSCFISYSHADQAFARRIHDTLQGRGIRCWLDEKQMNPGDDIYEEIHRGIRYWDKILVCCSETSLSRSGWVDLEINKALQKERDLMKERGEKVLALIPLNLDGFLFSSEYHGAMGDEIRRRVAADFTGWKHDNAIFEHEIERVIKALRTDGGKELLPKSNL